MVNDWKLFLNKWLVVTEAVAMLTSIATLVVAIAALRRWRIELKGKARFDIARRMVVQLYKLQRQFHAARSPITYSGESKSREKGSEERANESQILDEWYARNKRIETVNLALNRLLETSWEAEIVFGEGMKPAINEIEECVNELGLAISQHFTYQSLDSQNITRRTPISDNEIETRQKLLSKVYGVRKDELGQKLDKAVEKAQTYLKSRLTSEARKRELIKNDNLK